jgi:hypothetical protein
MPVVPGMYLIVMPRLQPAALLVVRCRYDRGAQAVGRGTARSASQVLDRRYVNVLPGPAAPRRSLQFTKAGSAATMPQEEKTNSADAQRDGFIPRGDVPGRHRRMFEP